MYRLAPELRVRAEVRVSPQVIAHSALLELSSEEIEERIEEEAERNPALEIVRRCEPIVTGFSGGKRATNGEPDHRDIASWAAAPTSARDDILMQFRTCAPPRLIGIGEVIISALDDRGYLRGDLSELADVAGVDLDDAELALSIIQRLEPPGIGARTLSECLLLQLERMDNPPASVVAFVEQCLDGGPRQMRRCARKLLGLSDEQIDAVLSFIRKNLSPYPALMLETPPLPGQATTPPPATPDVAIEFTAGRVVVTVPLSERLQLRIDAIYQHIERQLRNRRRLAEHEQRVRDRVRAARQLIRLLQRRQETLAIVAEAVARHQADYFMTGDPRALRPLDQKDIARATGLHESTVCRAVKAKHVLMPDGTLLPFDVFFDDALPAKVELHRLITAEPPESPYSDEQLAKLLAQRGYPLARRTVTKYRLQLGLPPAHKRRRSKRARRQPAKSQR